MARMVDRLTARGVETETKEGVHADGGGLYLRIGRGGSKSWVHRYMLKGKAREMGLGGLLAVSLAEARKKAAANRREISNGVDPLAVEQAKDAEQKAKDARAMTFKDCADAYVKTHSAGWKNAKHRQQWENTLATYVLPAFGSVPVADVDVAMIMKAIEPLWTAKPETAGRVRGRIEAVLDWAKVSGFRTGDNPARWRGHLSNLLPKKSKVHKVRHHPALPYTEVGTFMADLRAHDGGAARALELVILCAVRTGDIIGNEQDDKPPLRRAHVNLSERVWTIPSTKTSTEHRVPLSAAALAVLRRQIGGQGRPDDVVFPGMKGGQALSNMAMLNLIGRMNGHRTSQGLALYLDPKQGGAAVTPHGFRSTFRDWAAERTNFPRDVVEMALAHAIESDVESAYRRGDLLDKRRRLMDAWAEYCGKVAVAATVVNLRQVNAAANLVVAE